MARELPPVVKAPKGFIWAWNTPDEAHLVSVDDYSKPLCRENQTWHMGAPSMSYSVGGYSARPCGDCLDQLES